jgi:hypothetical protein
MRRNKSEFVFARAFLSTSGRVCLPDIELHEIVLASGALMAHESRDREN